MDLNTNDIDSFILQCSCNEIKFIIDSLKYSTEDPASTALFYRLFDEYDTNYQTNH